MGVGVFGKLPDQRDYVQHGMDGALMALVDPWIQNCLQHSHEQLGRDWLSVYLSAPIWRFWLGPSIIGKTVLGALMPSVDGVGRYFPLMLAAVSEDPFDVPEAEPQDPWFDAAEALLLAALAEEGTYQDLIRGLEALPDPVPGRCGKTPAEDNAAALAKLRLQRQHEFYGPLSFWWSPSLNEPEVPARAHMWRGLPPSQEYAMLLLSEGAGQEMKGTGVDRC